MRQKILFVLMLFVTTARTYKPKCYYVDEDFLIEGTVYSCIIQNSNIDSLKDEKSFRLAGTHVTNKTDEDVLAFWIFHRIYTRIPHGLAENYPNIATVYVEFSTLQEVHKEDLRQFGDKLIDLSLEGNEIKTIEKDLFKYNPNLKSISLINNKIQTIADNVFNNLNMLHGINLIKNDCINYVYYGREIKDFMRSIYLKCNEKFSSKGLSVPVIVNEHDYQVLLIKIYEKKIADLENKVKELQQKKCT